MTEFNLATLRAIYRSVLGDAIPENAAATEISRVVADLSASDAKRLDAALQAAGVDDFLATVCPVSTDSDWADDGWNITVTDELAEQGRAYLEKMLADGPAGIGPTKVSGDE